MAYVLDSASAKRIQNAIDESVDRSGVPNNTLVEALAYLDEWCWDRDGDKNCEHFTMIKGAHDTRFFMAPNGDWELSKRWGSSSPGKCSKCGKTKAYDNTGKEAKKGKDSVDDED